MHEAFKEPVVLPVFPINVREEPLECLKWIEGQVKLQGFAVEREARGSSEMTWWIIYWPGT